MKSVMTKETVREFFEGLYTLVAKALEDDMAVRVEAAQGVHEGEPKDGYKTWERDGTRTITIIIGG